MSVMLTILLKPEVKRLLEMDPMQRPELWLEQLAAATFDLPGIEFVTRDHRNATKRLWRVPQYTTSNVVELGSTSND